MKTDEEKHAYALAYSRTPEARAYQKMYREQRLDKERKKEHQARYREKNKEKIREQQRTRPKTEADKIKRKEKRQTEESKRYHRAWRLMKLYGMTIGDWEELFDRQGRVCALCGADDPGARQGWHTEHDHDTKRVRGITCKPCNNTLGWLGDSEAKIREYTTLLLKYVEEHS